MSLRTNSDRPSAAPATEHRSLRAGNPRERAIRRLEKKNKFRGDLFAYVVVNAFLVVIWAINDHGAFWPGWVMGGWGVFLLLDGWNAYVRRPITEEQIDQELRKGS